MKKKDEFQLENGEDIQIHHLVNGIFKRILMKHSLHLKSKYKNKTKRMLRRISYLSREMLGHAKFHLHTQWQVLNLNLLNNCQHTLCVLFA